MQTRLKGRVKAFKVKVNLANAAPVDGRTDVQAFISAWKAAQGLFRNREYLCHGVTVDATDILQWLDCIAMLEGGVEKPFEARVKSRISGKLTPRSLSEYSKTGQFQGYLNPSSKCDR